MKNRKILLGALFTGLLMSGLGAGIAITDFSEFTYGGKINIFEENVVTETFSVNVSPENSDYILVNVPYSYSLNENDSMFFSMDETLPDNTIEMELSYVPDLYQPLKLFTNIFKDSDFSPVEIVGEGEIIVENYNENSDKTINSVSVAEKYTNDDIQIFMLLKDNVLKDIKNKKVYDYNIQGVTKAVVKYSKNLDSKIISDLYY